MMRVGTIGLVVLLLSVASTTQAQEYVEFKSTADRFSATFPTQPKVVDTTIASQFNSMQIGRAHV